MKTERVFHSSAGEENAISANKYCTTGTKGAGIGLRLGMSRHVRTHKNRFCSGFRLEQFQNTAKENPTKQSWGLKGISVCPQWLGVAGVTREVPSCSWLKRTLSQPQLPQRMLYVRSAFVIKLCERFSASCPASPLAVLARKSL